MLAIEVFIFLFAVVLIVAFALIVNPPSALVNFFGGKKKNPKDDRSR
jgi:hypothetical protein